jgi:hypothetical protein
MPHRARGNWSWSAGAAVAAAILIVVTLSLVRWQPQPASASKGATKDTTGVAQEANETALDANKAARVETASPVEVANAGPGMESSQSNLTPVVNVEGTRPRRLTQSYQTASLSRPARRSGVAFNPNGASRLSNANRNASEREIATDFMPLSYDSGAMAMESGHVIRVELPRSALVSMGLPMNLERAGEPIKADVLMGDDGVARAIRFVR